MPEYGRFKGTTRVDLSTTQMPLVIKHLDKRLNDGSV